MKLHDFLAQHAMFPFPHPIEDRSAGTTDVSPLEVGLLKGEWKAERAVRDDTLVQKLCQALEDILGDAPLVAGAEGPLLSHFSPLLEFDDEQWLVNSSEAQSRSFLNMGFFRAVNKCLRQYGPYRFKNIPEQSVEGGSSKVDYVAQVNDESKALIEAKSPSLMKKVGEMLPPRGIELNWDRGQSLVPKILSKAALYLGLRQMEWLFLSCHNYWIVCRLVRDDEHPYLAYSPAFTIEGSSEPFRAFLGAILSVVKDVSVERSPYRPDMELDIIKEEEDDGPLSEDVIANDPGASQGSSAGRATTTRHPATHSHEHENTESELIVTSSSPNSPEYFQVWVPLYSMSNNMLALPHCAESSKRRLWLTRFIASGSTGNVWKCRFNNSDNLFAVKVVEVLSPSDADSRQRLRNEFNVYLKLDKAYHSGQLRDRIAPRCYGAFKGDHMDVLILDLCEGTLSQWGELSAPERTQVYQLVQDLHRIGIWHGDLEPRNIARARGGGLCLIDFSESKRHRCKESKVSELGTQAAPTPYRRCSELRNLQKCFGE